MSHLIRNILTRKGKGEGEGRVARELCFKSSHREIFSFYFCVCPSENVKRFSLNKCTAKTYMNIYKYIHFKILK